MCTLYIQLCEIGDLIIGFVRDVILACKDIEMLRMLQQYKHSLESQAKVVIHLKLDTEKFADREAILTYNATNKCQGKQGLMQEGRLYLCLFSSNSGTKIQGYYGSCSS